ncbi:MAG: altronate dehydratase [Kiritimatiellae bacterium]|nr:altronate dehydratase [Kiritimatiellia bacterium]
MKSLRIHPDDNVEIRLDGERAGHKFAVRPIRAGGLVLKYGYPIGVATHDIAPGEWVHTHNTRTRLSGESVYTYDPAARPVAATGFPPRTFQGYRRRDGRVGIRNDLFVIPTVACVNTACRRIAATFRTRYPSAPAPLVLEHPYGCSQLAEDHERTASTLAALARHPNAAGALVVGLGCENNTLDSFRERMRGFDGHPVAYLRAQDAGDEVEAGVRALASFAEACAGDRRVALPESELVVGLKCGGSDGLSGLSANSVIGYVSDRLSDRGGTTVFTEIPELFGAEDLLLNRCETRDVFERAAGMLNEFKRYYLSHNLPVYENPSPGNKEGGITTLEEKSLGCVHKSGRAVVTDVLEYGAPVRKHGVNMLWGPGNDPCACTALAAGGCHLILFSTGRGTPYGTVVPTLKLSSNTPLAETKPGWIDFDAGVVAAAAETVEDAGGKLYELLLETASGKPARNETYGYQEICLFKDGVTL